MLQAGLLQSGIEHIGEVAISASGIGWFGQSPSQRWNARRARYLYSSNRAKSMKLIHYLCVGLALLFLAGCPSVPKPQVIIEQRFVERHIPASLKRPCPPIWKKAGGPEVVGDLIDRGDVNEAGLRICSARMNKIIAWDKG